MFNGYLSVNSVEVLNSARSKAYVDAFVPRIEAKCTEPLLRVALGHSAYVSPSADAAPWYRSTEPETANFYGWHPVSFEGDEDSSQTIDTTELIEDGGVHVSPRYGSNEIRVKAVGIALNKEALHHGLAWLRDVLANDGCRDGVGCVGRDAKMFTSAPTTTTEATTRTRWFYHVEVQEGPKVLKELPSKFGAMVMVEFTLIAGRPWQFTSATTVATLAMDSAVNFNDPGGEDCNVATEAYDNFINDPFYTAIARPPQPPNIMPPNVLTITSWRRMTATISSTLAVRPGRPTPVVTITAGTSNLQYVRLRFYRADAGVDGCDYVGEFLVSFVPANAIMTIDARKKSILVQMSDGRVLTGGHLLYGSAGRPFRWPNMACDQTYTMTADMMPEQTGVTVKLDVAVRE